MNVEMHPRLMLQRGDIRLPVKPPIHKQGISWEEMTVNLSKEAARRRRQIERGQLKASPQ